MDLDDGAGAQGAQKFRDRIYKTLSDNLSTIKRELGSKPPREQFRDMLTGEFARVLGPLEVQTTVDAAWRAKTDELATRFLFNGWL